MRARAVNGTGRALPSGGGLRRAGGAKPIGPLRGGRPGARATGRPPVDEGGRLVLGRLAQRPDRALSSQRRQEGGAKLVPIRDRYRPHAARLPANRRPRRRQAQSEAEMTTQWPLEVRRLAWSVMTCSGRHDGRGIGYISARRLVLVEQWPPRGYVHPGTLHGIPLKQVSRR